MTLRQLNLHYLIKLLSIVRITLSPLQSLKQRALFFHYLKGHFIDIKLLLNVNNIQEIMD